jgi:hypothetical protein
MFCFLEYFGSVKHGEWFTIPIYDFIIKYE